MAIDERANFAKGTLSAGINDTATSIVLQSGEGAEFPTPTVGYSCVIWDIALYGNPADDPNVEIVRVTGLSTDTFTVTREQEGTTGVAHAQDQAFSLLLTKKMIDDLVTEIASKAPALGADDNYVTDAEKVVIGNTSGTNTGDQTLPVKATGAEIDTGTDDAKFATPKAIADSSILSDVVDDTTPELGGEMDCGAHSIGFTQQVATGDGTTTINWTLGNKFKFTFGAANETFTFTAPSNPCNLVLVLIQDGTGSRTATWPGTVKWAGGTAPTLSTAGASVDIVTFYFDGTNFFGVASLLFAVPV